MKNTIATLSAKKLLLTFLFYFGILKVFSQTICADLNPPGFYECEAILCTVCNLHGITGSTAGYGLDPDNDLEGHFCGVVQSVQYFEFLAAVPDLNITVTTSGCTVNTGIDLGLMEVCDGYPLPFCTGGDGTNSTTLSVNSLTVGEVYTLIIDVDASSACNFIITVDPPDGTMPFLPPPSTEIVGIFNVCPDITGAYELVPPVVGDIFWTLPQGAEIFDWNHNGNSITVQWGNTGGLMCATISAPCINGSTTFCQNVSMQPPPPTILPPATICSEDAPYELPWGEVTFVGGTFTHVISSFLNCDSTLKQTVNMLSTIQINLPAVELCENGCLTKCGETFCGYGNYSVTCQSFFGCDSVINFSIVPPSLFVADIQGAGGLNCSNSMITLSSAPSSGIKTWSNSAGLPLGTGNQIVLNSPGTYFLTVTLTLGGESCSLIDSIVITPSAPPTVVAMGAKLYCDTLPVFVHVDTLPGPATYTWSGPNGFASNLQNPAVTQLGIYIVTVVDLANGCSGKDTVFVTSCCAVSAGTLDSLLVSVCSGKDLIVGFHWNQNLGATDSLAFILYSDTTDPLGSILMYSDTTLFPFIVGLQQLDSIYYVAALAGSVLPDSSINFTSPCLSISPAQPVRWVSKPSITVTQGPDVVCKGDCLDLLFQFTGTAPFYFHFDITENGAPRFSQDVVSDSLQKTITICPSAFIQPQGQGTLNFNVNFFQDAICNCND